MTAKRKTSKGAPSGASDAGRSARLRARIKAYMLARYTREGLASIIAGFAEIESTKRRHARDLRARDDRLARLQSQARSLERASARRASATAQTAATDARVIAALLEILKRWPTREACDDAALLKKLVLHFQQSRGPNLSKATLYRSFGRVKG